MRIRAVIILCCLLWSGVAFAQSEQEAFFEKEIRPVLRNECLECHNEKNKSGSLALDSRAGWQRGGDNGPAIVPADPEASFLMRAIRHQEPGYEMPSKAPKLSEETIAAFETWIRDGAFDPRQQPESLESAGSSDWQTVAQERARWWCWQPLVQPEGSVTASEAIDAWVARGLQSAGIEPADSADRRTLIRRLSFQLCGLPPTASEVEAFVSDQVPGAWERCVDRFLARPDFGIHWARHWMDVVRYAETHGSEDDAWVPFAYRYRDYLIRSLNADLPYDQLIKEHLAGDLIPPRWNAELGLNESLIGLTFLRFVEFNQTPVDVKREEIIVIDSQIDAIGKAFQAITISCARCHDHKFDPISDEDYYALFGILRSTRTCMRVLDDPAVFSRDLPALVELQNQLRQAVVPAWQNQVQAWPKQMRAAGVWCQENWSPDTKWEDLQQRLPDDPWTKALAHCLCEPDENSLTVFARLLVLPEGEQAGKWQSIREAMAQQQQAASRLPIAAEPLFELTPATISAWRIVGAGLPLEPLAGPGRWAIEGHADATFSGILEQGYHSNLLSDKHGGSLRSPDFVLDMEEISLRVRGSGNARARLVIENFQGDSLLFASANPTLDSALLTWITIPIKPQWRGLRAHLELLTRDDKPYVGIIKEPIELEATSGRSSFGISAVMKHPSGSRPSDPPVFPFAEMLASELQPAATSNTDGPGNAAVSEDAGQAWIELFCQATQQSLERLAAAQTTDADARWLTVIMRSGLLVCSLPADEHAQSLVQAYQQTEDAIPIARRSPGVHEDLCAVNQPWLPRGDHRRPGADTPRRYLDVLGSSADAYAGQASGRAQLAEEIASARNPLTARVYVNRVWHWLFGRGIVSTVDNFGRMGEAPTHPELLDQLAIEFMQQGWSTKRLIRAILLSDTWQRSSTPTPSAAQLDPGNTWWSHASVRRVEAESVRDTLLFVSGRMKEPDSGPGTLVYYTYVQEPNKQSPPGPLDGDGRRSIFLEVRRNFPNEFLLTFDFPRPSASAGKRPVASVPSQSLALLNDPFVVLHCERWAERVLAEESTAPARITRLYMDLLSRQPTAEEQQQAQTLIDTFAAREQEPEGWKLLAHALVNLKEAIYLP